MHKEHGTSRGSKPVHIGYLHMGLISHLHHQVAPEYRVRDKARLSLQNYSSDCPMKNGLVPSPLPRLSPQLLSNSTSPHERRTSTLSYPSPASAPTSQMKLWSTCNLCNLVLSQLMIKRNMKSKRSLTPGSGGASYGTWLSSLGGRTLMICGSPTLMSMPQQL